MRKFLLSATVAAAAFSVAPAALAVVPATTANYSFTDCFAGCTGSVASIASLSITQIANGVSFELTSTSANDSFISGLYFNGVSGSVDWDVSFQSYKGFSFSTIAKPNVTTAANGYNWDFTFPTAAKNDRFVDGDVAKWTITGNGVDLAHFASPGKMMIHLQNVPTIGSEKVGAVLSVPEPESYAMLLAGLGLMGTIARRRS